jgi:hypothetical protein
MPLKSLHFILTYRCIYQCDHCFLHCGPHQAKTFTAHELEGLLAQAGALEGLDSVYFEGGEPMLYYPLLLRGVRTATELGLSSGIVTCGYYATDSQDGAMWLEPLKEAGLTSIDISLDELHGTGAAYTNARNLIEAAEGLGLAVGIISIADPRKSPEELEACTCRGEVPSPSYIRGRAAHELVEGLDLRPIDGFVECSLEDLETPKRVHVDPYGNVHICQGILAGNVWETSLAQVVQGYQPHDHPVIGPLIKGGPAMLARETLTMTDLYFATECHACYEVRRRIRPEHPGALGPAEVYGEDAEPPPTSYD